MVILSIETSTSVCSAAISQDGRVIDSRISTDGTSHAVALPQYIDELLERNKGLHMDAIALSEGPGSYTGLRIGTSMAKGLAYGMNIPLIAIPTLKILVEMVRKTQVGISPDTLLCPMLDARRMEVYTAVYSPQGQEIQEVTAKIIDKDSFLALLPTHPILFFGDGASKCKEVIQHKNAGFVENIIPNACYMGEIAEEKMNKRDFVNIAYFEPYYLKEFVAAPSHIKGLK